MSFHFTPIDLAFIREHYPSHCTGWVAAQLGEGVTASHVSKAAYKMHVLKTPEQRRRIHQEAGAKRAAAVERDRRRMRIGLDPIYRYAWMERGRMSRRAYRMKSRLRTYGYFYDWGGDTIWYDESTRRRPALEERARKWYNIKEYPKTHENGEQR